MREIIFRGKRVDNGEWVYGSFVPDLLEALEGVDGLDGFIKPFGRTKEERLMVEVERDTVGQYTGRTDKNGKKIFEGDIVKTNFFGKDDGKGHNFAGYDKFFVNWNDCGFVITNHFREFGIYKSDASIEVVGNIHENPELVK